MKLVDSLDYGFVIDGVAGFQHVKVIGNVDRSTGRLLCRDKGLACIFGG